MQKLALLVRGLSANLVGDRRGVAAVEFAVIVPVMLTLFFGMVEFSNGVAADRKISLVARTLSDLTSQSLSVSDLDLTNFTTAAGAILTPYSTTPLQATITELFVDTTTLVARVQWSKGSAARATGSTVTIPAALKIGGTYLIFTEVNYRYQPTIGYVMAPAGVPLSDVAYTRPRESACVIYPTPSSGTLPACPTL